MPDVSVLDVLLYGEKIGTLTLLPGERTLFAFNEAYINDAGRPTLSLSFKDALGGLITDIDPTRVRVPAFFANMLPEGEMREYLAERAGVNPRREFFLLWVLGRDLPGAVTINPAEGEAWPLEDGGHEQDGEENEVLHNALRFSLAGVQLKFSAVKNASNGLTIPVDGAGGSWIVKLPSTKYASLPENEFAMMTLAGKVGIEVPEVQLVDTVAIEGLPAGIDAAKGRALAIKRFDRTPHGPVHIEDFAQVFGVFPDDKYRQAGYRNVAEVIAAESGNEGVTEFIRRIAFNALIGNADMHLKNWSMIYPDRRSAKLSPAYDFVSTIHYIPDDKAALTLGRTKLMSKFSLDEFAYLAGKARLGESLVLRAVKETVTRFHDAWAAEKKNLPLTKGMIETIERHIKTVPIAKEK